MVTVTLASFPRRRVLEALAALGWLRLAVRGAPGVRWARVVGVGASDHGFGWRPAWRQVGVVAVRDGVAEGWAERYLGRRAHVERWVMRPRRWHGRWGRRDPLAVVPSRPVRTGPDATGPVRSGADATGPVPSGPVETPPVPTGPDATAPVRMGPVGVITHGRLRRRVLPRFWRKVPPVASQAVAAPGFVTGFGFGAVPLVALATFSVWSDEASMKAFAWDAGPHSRLVATTRERRWFRSEFFAVLDVL